MAYCLQCGHQAHEQIPTGDNRLRLVCPACHHIHYENPKTICGALVHHQDKILLCRRAIEPQYGKWTLPAGFMEIGETLAEGAIRETLEEADAIAINPKLYCLFDIPVLGQIHAMYLADLADGKFGVGSESLECALFTEQQIPWDELAFETVTWTLKQYLADRRTLQQNGQDPNNHRLYPLHEPTLGKDNCR